MLKWIRNFVLFMRFGSDPDMTKSKRRPQNHDWEYFSDGLKRKCKNTGEEQWVFENPYPDIGEPRYEWKTVFDDKKLRRT